MPLNNEKWLVLQDKHPDPLINYGASISPTGGFYSRQPISNTPWLPPATKDSTPEETLTHNIQSLFDLNQISEDLYNKLMQALLEELDK